MANDKRSSATLEFLISEPTKSDIMTSNSFFQRPYIQHTSYTNNTELSYHLNNENLNLSLYNTSNVTALRTSVKALTEAIYPVEVGLLVGVPRVIVGLLVGAVVTVVTGESVATAGLSVGVPGVPFTGLLVGAVVTVVTGESVATAGLLVGVPGVPFTLLLPTQPLQSNM